MKKLSFQNKILPLGLVTVMSLSLAGYALATSGGAGDPLISLSYLEETVTPTLEKNAIDQAEIAVADAEKKINAEISALKEELSGGHTSGASAFLIITLSQGEKITLGSGAQGVLRVGRATVSGSNSPALLNLSKGDTLSNGESLVINQLYLAESNGCVITAQESTVKIMVSGSYTVS